MNKKKLKPIRYLILICVVGICIVFYMKNFKQDRGLRVTNWDNTYNENNITMFYEELNSKSKNLEEFQSKYKVKEILSSGDGEIEKILRSVDILKNIVEYDDVNDSLSTDAYGILSEKGEKRKASGRDMAIIERDILLSAGIQSRIGEFKKAKPQFQDNPSYYVVEYWSEEYNKWIMIDFMDRGYLEKDKIPLSAIELIGNLKETVYVGKSSQNKYKSELKKYLSSYTIPIDNTTSMKKSNSYITYCSSEKDIDLKKGDKYIPATVFTEEKELFTKSPKDITAGKDEKAYLILMKKPMETSKEYTYVVGGFRDGKVIRNYYIRTNEGEMKKVDMYDEVKFEVGANTIELSLDGTNIISKVEIQRDK